MKYSFLQYKYFLKKYNFNISLFINYFFILCVQRKLGVNIVCGVLMFSHLELRLFQLNNILAAHFLQIRFFLRSTKGRFTSFNLKQLLRFSESYYVNLQCIHWLFFKTPVREASFCLFLNRMFDNSLTVSSFSLSL